MKIDFSKYNTKEKFLKYIQEKYDELYSLNYDALIDVLTSTKNLVLELENITQYNEYEELLDTIKIIKKDNNSIKIIIL